MKSTVTADSIERGILTSAYKQEIKEAIRDMHSESLLRIKSRLLSQHEKLQSNAGTILQVSLFAVVLVLVLF